MGVVRLIVPEALTFRIVLIIVILLTWSLKGVNTCGQIIDVVTIVTA